LCIRFEDRLNLGQVSRRQGRAQLNGRRAQGQCKK
jgi:hypothetical protein